MARRLSGNQEGALAMLQHWGYWSRRCGWMWDTISGTERLMETLVRRGLATKSVSKRTGRVTYKPV